MNTALRRRERSIRKAARHHDAGVGDGVKDQTLHGPPVDTEIVEFCSLSSWCHRDLHSVHTGHLRVPQSNVVGGGVGGNRGRCILTHGHIHIVKGGGGGRLLSLQIEDARASLGYRQNICHTRDTTGYGGLSVRYKEHDAPLVVSADVLRMQIESVMLAYIALGQMRVQIANEGRKIILNRYWFRIAVTHPLTFSAKLRATVTV
jgi:hypothetical protein